MNCPYFFAYLCYLNTSRSTLSSASHFFQGASKPVNTEAIDIADGDNDFNDIDLN